MRRRGLLLVRRVSQVFFLCLFLFLLAGTRLPQDIYENYSVINAAGEELKLETPVSFFFQLDPLVAVTSFLSAHEVVQGVAWAVAVLLATLLLGRFFCGFVCPLGTLNHWVGSAACRMPEKRRASLNRPTRGRRVKYLLLLVLLGSCALGLNLSGLMDPISFLFRGFALAVIPGLGSGLFGLVHAMTSSDVTALRLAGYGLEVLVAPVFGFDPQAFQTGWFIGLLLLLVLWLNRLRPRFWCRVLCPLGALLGLVARLSPLRLRVDETRCTSCGNCLQHCQGAASPGPWEPWDRSECLLCLNCYAGCPERAISFRMARPAPGGRGPDLDRRAVLGGIFAGVALPLLGRVDGNLTGIPDPRLIRPPGALPEKAFLQRCQRCGLCMKVCPTNAIQPAWAEGGVSGLWTPLLVMNRGYCEYTCTLCGSVCPTGAIEALSVREKIEKPVRIGSAHLERGRCLPWSGNGPCIVCEEHCPTSPKAIHLKEQVISGPDGEEVPVRVPYVDLKRCVGCGICENRCPVKGRPAIQIIAAGESRSVKQQILL